MPRTCPSCQAALTPKSRFCPSCGANTPLEETVQQPSEQQTQPLRASGEKTTGTPATVAHSEPAASARSFVPPPTPRAVEAAAESRPPERPAPAPHEPAPPRSTRSPFAETSPFELSLTLRHALVEGHMGTIAFRVRNDAPLPIENAELYLSSRGLAGESVLRIRRLAPAARADLLAEVEAVRSGHFILQIAASWDQGGQRYSYRGNHPLRIYKAPDNSNIVINIGDIQSNTGGGANQALGAEYGDVQISNLIERGAIKTLNDLLDLELPENFQRIELDLDYEVSRVDSGYRGGGGSGKGALRIPAAYLATVQPATVCTFEAAGAEDPLPFRLVSRAQFRLGRARADADFVTWLMPRGTANDEKTKRVSKVQAIAEATGAGIAIRDNASANGTLFDNIPLDEKGTALPRQGRLQLAGAVEIDFMRIAPAAEQGLSLANGRQWAGPEKSDLAQNGSVRFEVVGEAGQPLNAVWLLSDASFGTSRSNSIPLQDSALAEVQGRFHRHRGCFWIESLVDNSAVQIDHTTLRPGEVVPLATGQRLRLGTRTWRLRLE